MGKKEDDFDETVTFTEENSRLEKVDATMPKRGLRRHF